MKRRSCLKEPSFHFLLRDETTNLLILSTPASFSTTFSAASLLAPAKPETSSGLAKIYKTNNIRFRTVAAVGGRCFNAQIGLYRPMIDDTRHLVR